MRAMSSHSLRIRRTPLNTLQTVQASKRIHDVKTYPVQSPQGATIIIYSHEKGLTILWRGGRRFKPSTTPSTSVTAANGDGNDSVMIIDSDDEDQVPAKGQPSTPFVDTPEFEESESDSDEVVQSLDLNFGTAVLHVGVVPLQPCSAHAGPQAMLKEQMVFAVSCVTKDVYVVTLPLTPPSPESKARSSLRSGLLAGKAGSGAWGESLFLLGGQLKRGNGIAINLIPQKPRDSPRVVVASHSRDAAGTLRLWDVPLQAKGASSLVLEPFQTEYLPKPLSRIAFNPTHHTQLLCVSTTDAARIYDYASPSLPPDPDARGPFPAQGSWLLSLYQPFTRPSSLRKPILDAAWIAHGKAIFVLLADGMWGIWDIDGVSPSAAGANIATKLKSGVKGAAITAFSVSGYVEGTSTLRTGISQSQESGGGLAPMTPHTRKQATSTLSSSMSLGASSSVRGGLKVLALPSDGKTIQDESIGLWIGNLEQVFIIPGINRFWDSQLRRGSGGGVNLFSGAQPTKMIKLSELRSGLVGERCCGVDLVLNHENVGTEEGGLPVDAIVQGESRLIFVHKLDDPLATTWAAPTAKRLFSGNKSTAIIVRGQEGHSSSRNFDLSTFKPGSLRGQSSLFSADVASGNGMTNERALPLPSRLRTGFDFTHTIADAADVSGDLTGRDVDLEMLDIMHIDRELETMEDGRENGRKKVFFNED